MEGATALSEEQVPGTAGAPVGGGKRRGWVRWARFAGPLVGAVIGVTAANWGQLWHSGHADADAHAVVVLPAAVEGYAQQTDADAAALVQQILAQGQGKKGIGTHVAGVYGPDGSSDVVVVEALTGHAGHPDQDIADDIDKQRAATGVTMSPVDAGPLGGKAVCGTGTSQGAAAAICEWIDADTFGRLVWSGALAADGPSHLQEIRAQIEHTY